MSVTRTAMFVGLLLGLVAAFGTFTQFFLVVLFGAAGLLIGAIIDGKVDISELTKRTRR